MKIQIRKNCFETNSSSMHAIVIAKSPVSKDSINIYHTLKFEVDEFGWEHVRYYDADFKAKYLWTCIVNNFLKRVYTGNKKKGWNDVEYDEYNIELDIENPEYKRIKETIKKYLVDCGFDGFDIEFQETFEKESWGGISTGYIDHDPGIGFVDEIISSEDRFIRFMFNKDSIIETWNDNEWEINEAVEEALEKEYSDGEGGFKDNYWETWDWTHFTLPIPEEEIEWKYLKGN